MATSKLVEISRELIGEGVSPETPAMLVRNAGAYDESIISTTVEEMTDLFVPAPALLVVGHIVKSARVEKKALFTGRNPYCVRVKEPIIHQALVTQVSEHDRRFEREHQSSLKMLEPKPKPLDLSYFSALIFDSSVAVDAFVDIYGTLPDHLLCYAGDDKIRQDLLKRSVDPWRIVLYPTCDLYL